MNFYLVVEGKRTEQKVFAKWIPVLNTTLKQVSLPGELSQNSFVIISGHGYPQYLKIVRNAALDILRNPHYGQLVVSVDAEDEDPEDVRNLVLAEVREVHGALVPEIVVQNACIESWFLGSRRALRRFPISPEAKDWKSFYDVWNACPELLPARTERELNRAQTAFAYLVSGLLDKGPHMRYSKRRPDIVCDPAYLGQLRDRAATSGHLESFQQFVGVF